jgi:hypothetical protein
VYVCAGSQTHLALLGMRVTIFDAQVNQYSVSDAALELRNRNNLGTDAVQCGIVFSYTESYKGKDLYSVNFNSSAIAWQGICISGTCAICKNGERRCGESYGHPRGRAQLCVNGQVCWPHARAAAPDEANDARLGQRIL